jgi:sulfonate transport system permease protein
MSIMEGAGRIDSGAGTPARRLPGGRAVWTRLLPAVQPWIVPGLALVAWQAAARLGWSSSRVLPSPSEVWRAAARLSSSGELATHVAISSRRAALGFLLGGGIGLGFGLLNGLSRTAERLFDTTLQMGRAVPHLALVPLFILWLGIGEVAKVALVALGAVFPVYLNTLHGLRSIDPRLIEMARVHGLGRAGLLRRVILPGALPSILVGVRYGLGVTWLTLIVAETISADSGIGYLAMNAREFFQADVVMVAILLYALLGKLADVATRLLERGLLPWHATLGTRRAAR